MKQKLLIIGASGHGKVVADAALKMNAWTTIEFLDDNLNSETSLGLKVVGKTSDIMKFIDEYDIFIGIGNNSLRESIQNRLELIGASIPVIIHPNAVIGEQVEIGNGTLVMAGVVVNCCTYIGRGSIINTGATIDHDNDIGDYVHVSPGVHLAGNVTIGSGTWLGIGTIVSNNVNITVECRLGAGAVVISDISDSGTYVGMPVRRV